MDMRGHHLQETEQGLSCARCLRSWSQIHRSRRFCPGVPWYVRGQAPDDLFTFTQLKQRGLQPANRFAPDSCIVTAYDDLISLYDIRQARPRRTETERQKTAREATWLRIQEQYRCAHCGYTPLSLSDIRFRIHSAGLCLSCKERLEWENRESEIEAQTLEDHRAACTWAYDLLQRSDWALIDTETTSLAGVVCEIGVLAPDGSVLFESLVNPECHVSVGARALHGLTDEILATAPTLPNVWAHLQEALQGRTWLIAYNAAFDQARLKQSARRSNLPALSQEWQCAMERYASYCGNWSEYHHSYTWVPLDGGHRAIEDARAALSCLREMARAYKQTPESGGRIQ